MTVTAYPRSQHWTVDGFRISVLHYRSNHGPCMICGKRPAQHSVWASGRGGRDGWTGGPEEFCDDHRPARGVLPPLDYCHFSGGAGRVTTQFLNAHPEWPCGECGAPSTMRVVDRCWGCGDRSFWRGSKVTVLTFGAPPQDEMRQEHAMHQTGEWYRCAAHPLTGETS